MGNCLFVRRALLALLAVLVSLSLALADTKTEKPALTEEQRQRNLDSFDYVWKTVRDKHWDPKTNGVDWEAVRTELRPRVEKAATNAEARGIMMEMLKKLGQSHFTIIPRGADSSEPAEKKAPAKSALRQADGIAGFDLRVVDGQALVVKVEELSPAAKAGVKTGWVLLKVHGEETEKALEPVRKTYKDSSHLDLYLAHTVKNRLLGRIGEKVPMVFRNGDDQEIALDVPLMRPPGRVAGLGIASAGYVRLESRRLDGTIGYIALNSFFDPVNVSKEFQEALWSKPLASGIILDLRGNTGGIGPMALGMGNWFVDKPDQKLGTMTLRSGTLHYILNPQAETFTGPLAVLVDGCSASTSEILAGGLQGLKRARIFGTRTAGAALLSLIERLPNGDGFQFAIANYVAVDGKVLEGAGVQPDQEVKPDRKALLAGRDPVIDAAVQWIKEQTKPGKAGEVKNGK